MTFEEAEMALLRKLAEQEQPRVHALSPDFSRC
jgi:hypothetical protein